MLRKLSLVSSFLLVLSLTAPGAQKQSPQLQRDGIRGLSVSDRGDIAPCCSDPKCPVYDPICDCMIDLCEYLD